MMVQKTYQEDKNREEISGEKNAPRRWFLCVTQKVGTEFGVENLCESISRKGKRGEGKNR